MKAILYVSGDSLRVVDESNKVIYFFGGCFFIIKGIEINLTRTDLRHYW